MFPAVEEWGVAQAGANARRAPADVVFYGTRSASDARAAARRTGRCAGRDMQAASARYVILRRDGT
ncbi:hypothetical protein EGY19_22485 [Burkholderia multivorans]|uniref:Uncharacterized protein n=1 Tax=Burkholderia multivorans TaxID=87883 RepID=A0AB37AU87_9BURK|nr:hypothetical protein EGY19_22485 [Burkholderia multivorans]EEE01839.1 hypothetical protein BURMUCGD1_5685 [Burkholderia multivorans CGD1]EJO59423.1 hypothetical protein BURMUCF2_A2140 [Burkholderia multivorans CF2]PRE50552.1 hypothetical protein C6P97_11610 [Burkholderia multivorans]PRE50847.1 hypothetical protein C6P99_11405 [Burkholderia multivorans]